MMAVQEGGHGYPADAGAAELRILIPRSIWTVLNEIGPQFERTSGYKLNVVTDLAATLARRINDGDGFDVFISPPAQMNQLIQNNKIIANTRTAIARSGIGVEVRAGKSKPDISSVDAFKRALLDAKSIGYLKPEGTSGVYLAGLLDRLGIAEAVKSRSYGLKPILSPSLSPRAKSNSGWWLLRRF